MIALRQRAANAAGRLRNVSRPANRRYASDGHAKTGDQVHHWAGSSTEHGTHHAGPADESLGVSPSSLYVLILVQEQISADWNEQTGFYVCIAAIPISIGVYSLSRSSKDGRPAAFSRFIDGYSYYKEKWAARNTLHTAMIEQAAFDRNLFQSARASTTVPLKFPE